ncbi:MAG TPA: deoxyribonuclease IV [Methanocorpusculum sp.]|jgi:deoxyribonuclease IV|uniref:Probable endonuclease 4 n=1 Tax=Methanocorpusculum parvum TaxID=2193 RepID=A0AAX0Q9P9_9EURY|nr:MULTISPECIES: deoxyribonuclease IV [Methanocorpusculum]MDD2248915.1 deoxyribonuclease IV [Methanocorpusculum sp.]MDD2803491.1 deoxyribonuclease IV [Methanocorpusculum sp.]MEA5085997.1 deoxyribonuclease IV [Methanocorpusculum sp.]PAV10272.1 endonuclease [Methanocorpusculum parvum]HJJ35267.1 deoxyribonuclease IV [Methanocorpusculum sp.]
MIKLGFHVSIAGSLPLAVSRAEENGCDTFQIFTRSPRVWAAKPIEPAVAKAFKDALTVSGIGPVVDHMPYLPNPAAEKPEIYARSIFTMTEELDRCDQLKIPYLVTHLGHHGKEDGHKKGQEKVIAAIGQALDESEGETMILLENTANEKNTVGGTFTDVGVIADALSNEKRIGFCFDTCHAAAAGYDLKGHGAETVFGWFNDEAGRLDRLKVIHLNDMKGGVGSHLDRHEHLGLGYLGEETIRDVLTFPKISHCAFIMETPSDEIRTDKDNMAVARRLAVSS